MSLPSSTRLVSNSEVKEFKRCRRRWWLGSVRRFKPAGRDLIGARALGNRVHDALAAYYGSRVERTDPMTPEEVLSSWDVEVAAFRTANPEFAEANEYRKESDLGRAMLEGYFEWLAETGVDSDWIVEGAEQEVALPFDGYSGPRPVTLIAKKDVRIHKLSNGARSFVDHKTCQSLNDLPKTADINEQFLHYSLLDYLEYLQHGGDAQPSFVDGGVFNMLRKVKRTAAAKPPFFGRYDVRHTIDELRSYWLRLAGEVADMQSCEDRLAAGEDHRIVAYPNPTHDCSWDCDFRPVCPMLDDPRSDPEGFLADAYVVGDPYERYVTIEGLKTIKTEET